MTTQPRDFKFQWFRALLRSNLHPTSKFVALVVWDDTNKHGRNSHKGNAYIAGELGISLRTVKTHMGILRESGWITRTSAANKHPDRRWADVYELALPEAQNLVPDNVPGATSTVPGATSAVPGAICDGPGATLVAPQQVSSTSFLNKFQQHSESEDSVGVTADATPGPKLEKPKAAQEANNTKDKVPPPDDDDSLAVWDWFEDELAARGGPPLTARESGMALWMREDGKNYRAILNAILKKRRAAAMAGSDGRW